MTKNESTSTNTVIEAEAAVQAEDCRPCVKPCQSSCSHSRCAKKCSDPCTPCAESCQVGCEHTGRCSLPCAVPCNVLPCSKRCEKSLSCEHRCPSVCGEICPDQKFYQVCGEDDVLGQRVDWVALDDYRDVNLDETPVVVLECGHLMTMVDLDNLMKISEHYHVDDNNNIISIKKTLKPFDVAAGHCVACRHVIQSVRRYSRITKRALMDDST